MKRIISVVVVLMAMITINAQGIETLDSVRVEPDVLLSTEGKIELRSHHVVIEIYDNGTVKWHLQNPPHIFVDDKDAFGNYKGYCDVKIALYKEDGSLLSMGEKWRGIPSEHGSYMQMVAKGEVVNARDERAQLTIADWLFASKLQRGSYFRVVSPVYGDYLMDVKFRIPDRWYFSDEEKAKYLELLSKNVQQKNEDDTKMKLRRRR